MSKPRTMERKLRQRRKTKLAKLREKFMNAKTQDSKERLVGKAEKVSPNFAKSEYSTLWSK